MNKLFMTFVFIRKVLCLCIVLLLSFPLYAAEVPYKTVDFSSATMQHVSTYTSTWTATVGADTWSITNFNNNNGIWSSIKCGRRKKASVAYITTDIAYSETITKVIVTTGAVVVGKVNGTVLEVASDNAFSTNLQTISGTIVENGDVEYSIPTPIANGYYRLTFDCASHSKSGFVEVKKVIYYYNSGGVPCTTLPAPSAGFSSDALTATSATLTWGEVTNASSYVVTITDAHSYNKTVVAATNSLMLNDLVAGTSYAWTVKAKGNGTTYCDSPESATQNFSTPAAVTHVVTLNNAPHGSATLSTNTVSDNGSVTVSINPSPCWTPEVNVTAGTANDPEDNGDGTWTISSITTDITVEVTYTAFPTYTINLNAGTGSVSNTTLTQSSPCAAITLPTPTVAAACAGDWHFAGWATAAVNVETTTAPALIPAGAFTPTGNATLYAVYTTTVGGGSPSSTTYIFNSRSWGATPENWISGQEGHQYSTAKGLQISQNSSGANATSPTPFNDVSSVVVSYRTNASSGAGSIEISIGGVTKSKTVTSAEGTSLRDVVLDFSAETPSGAPKITVLCTQNSIYINSVTIATGSGASYFSNPSCTPCTDPNASFAKVSLSLRKGETGSMVLNTLNTNAKTWESNNTDVATVDPSTGVVTAVANGSARISVRQDADGAYCAVFKEFTVYVREPGLEVVEWKEDGLVVELDINGTPQIIMQEQQTIGSGNVATELFFSKYFEAHSENKMLAIFNGTSNTISLADYEIRKAQSSPATLSLASYGKTPGQIAPNEEIIFVAYGSPSAESCAQTQPGYENWNVLGHAALKFGGRSSIGLYKNGTLIDVIGASDGHGNLINMSKKCNHAVLEDNDAPGFYCVNGDNVRTTIEENNYTLSTNRCLLIRKNSVLNGQNAVATNIYGGGEADAISTTGICNTTVPTSFHTLSSEWRGFRIGAGKSNTPAVLDSTCTGLAYVGGYDYSNYYKTYVDVPAGTYNTTENGDGTYTIGLPNLASRACDPLKIKVVNASNPSELLLENTYKVPILVSGAKQTTATIFTNEPGCATCDVVVLNNATLTKAADSDPNDKPKVRNLAVYPGGQLFVPAGTNYTVNTLSMRSKEDVVSSADIQGTLNRTSTSVFHDKRITNTRWYWITLPYACRIQDVTFRNGEPAVYGTDWYLKYYDGAARAATQTGGKWKMVPAGTTLQAGEGYIVAIEGKSGHAYSELRFPMAGYDETSNKDVTVHAYGATQSITPNHKGWNLVGNPYMDTYKQNHLNDFGGLVLGKLQLNGEGNYELSGTVPYVTIPQNGGYSEYAQVLVSATELPPFISYFVQVDGTSNGEEKHVLFTPANTKNNIVARRNTSFEDLSNAPIVVSVTLANQQKEQDETSLVLADRFTADYEIGGDLYKWKGEHYKSFTKPVLFSRSEAGELAFQALHDTLAEHSVSVGYFAAKKGAYTFALNRDRDLSQVTEVWLYDTKNNAYTNLLESDYTFITEQELEENSTRFTLAVKVKRRPVATGTELSSENNVYVVSGQETMTLCNLPADGQVWLFDATGKLLLHEAATHVQRTYSLTQGVYLVRVLSAKGNQVLRAVVK